MTTFTFDLPPDLPEPARPVAHFAPPSTWTPSYVKEEKARGTRGLVPASWRASIELLNELDRLSDEAGISRSALLRRIAAEYVRRAKAASRRL